MSVNRNIKLCFSNRTLVRQTFWFMFARKKSLENSRGWKQKKMFQWHHRRTTHSQLSISRRPKHQPSERLAQVRISPKSTWQLYFSRKVHHKKYVYDMNEHKKCCLHKSLLSWKRAAQFSCEKIDNMSHTAKISTENLFYSFVSHKRRSGDIFFDVLCN